MRQARLQLILLSKGYQESWYCLEELKIAAENNFQNAVPVFIEWKTEDIDEVKLSKSLHKMREDLRQREKDLPDSIKDCWREILLDIWRITGETRFTIEKR